MRQQWLNDSNPEELIIKDIESIAEGSSINRIVICNKKGDIFNEKII